jgi:hypothetical protein
VRNYAGSSSCPQSGIYASLRTGGRTCINKRFNTTGTRKLMIQHVDVYREAGRFAGWPANYGIWSWGNEIVVGFTLGYLEPSVEFHARDETRPFLPMQARSLDGGLTWETQPTPCKTPGSAGMSADEHLITELRSARALEEGRENLPVDCPGGIPFHHPDFALMCARTGLGAGTTAWFYTSLDRCQSWQGPYKLPDFGQAGIEARTDYIVTGPDECLLFLTASKSSGGEGEGILCVEMTSGGRAIKLRSWVTRAERGYAIMPATCRVGGRDGETGLVTAVRCQEPGENAARRNFINIFGSDNLGQSWRYLSQPVPASGQGGNPPALTRLSDGRLVLTYGWRAKPFGIRARVSLDQGASWGDEIILREDAGNHDIGYPRTVQREDGSLVTTYYYNDNPEAERYIGVTIWRV